MHSRREFGKRALAGLSLPLIAGMDALALDSTVRGVKLGIITGSLGRPPEGRDPVDYMIESCKTIGAGNVELVNFLEPRLVGAVMFGHPPNPMTPEFEKSRTAVREWRLKEPLSTFTKIRDRFKSEGINLFSYVMTFDLDFTDEEIDAVFKQMQALGVDRFCTNQSRVDVGPRLVPFAEKYKIKPAWHPHAMVNDANEVATPASIEKLLAMSKMFVVNLDIGHFTAGNNDAVEFIKQHHDRISHIHIKDRKRDQGKNVKLGEGDTPIRQCLHLIRDNKWPIYGIIEREFNVPDVSPVEQTKGQMEYLKQLLNS